MKRLLFAVVLSAAGIGVASPASATTVYTDDTDYTQSSMIDSGRRSCANPIKVGKGSVGVDVDGDTVRVCTTQDSNSGIEARVDTYTLTYDTAGAAAGTVTVCVTEGSSTGCVSGNAGTAAGAVDDWVTVFNYQGVCDHDTSASHPDCVSVYTLATVDASSGARAGVFVCEGRGGFFECRVNCYVYQDHGLLTIPDASDCRL